MSDTPRGLLGELRWSLLKRRVGQIALAVLLAEAVWSLIRSLTWYLFLPVLGRLLHGQTESVLFKQAWQAPIPWDNLLASMLEFVLTVIVVIYANRWVERRPSRHESLARSANGPEPAESNTAAAP